MLFNVHIDSWKLVLSWKLKSGVAAGNYVMYIYLYNPAKSVALLSDYLCLSINKNMLRLHPVADLKLPYEMDHIT